MSRIRQFALLLLLAVWLPVTQHCGLEAAGILDQDQAGDCLLGAPGLGDDCGIVESGLYKATASLTSVPAPTFSVSACLLCLQAAHLAAVEHSTLIQRRMREHTRAWVPSWHFVRRTAPPSRAPSLLLA